jgi:hypothetical protein
MAFHDRWGSWTCENAVMSRITTMIEQKVSASHPKADMGAPQKTFISIAVHPSGGGNVSNYAVLNSLSAGGVGFDVRGFANEPLQAIIAAGAVASGPTSCTKIGNTVNCY